MATKAGCLFFLVLIVFLCSLCSNEALKADITGLPEDFIFGAATSAYQVEGAKARGLNIWDSFTHRYPERTPDGATGDIAVGSYDYYKDDVALLKNMGLDAYRFSIAWSRLLPGGKLCRGVNEEGIQYYNNLIDQLKNNSIEPFVTLFHWDLPQTLEDEYGGFLSPLIVTDFRDFADLCFKTFGDRVKYWITENQPYSYSYKGYGDGTYPPVRCSKPKCISGDSGTEPYIVTHHLHLAHAAAVKLYRARYQATQKGKIGTTLITRWFLPYSNTTDDQLAAMRSFDFLTGWYLHPLIYGDYPPSMKEIVGNRLPNFTQCESDLVKGSFDFIGLNYYFTQYAKNTPNVDPYQPSVVTDPQATLSFTNSQGEIIGPQSCGFYYYPEGFFNMLQYVKLTYQNPLVYITENGFCDDGTLSLEETLNDQGRITYIKKHLIHLLKAIKKDSNVKGYFVWSLLDNYEFLSGFSTRFGMNYVDFNNVTVRQPKASANWLTKLLQLRKKALKSLPIEQELVVAV